MILKILRIVKSYLWNIGNWEGCSSCTHFIRPNLNFGCFSWFQNHYCWILEMTHEHRSDTGHQQKNGWKPMQQKDKRKWAGIIMACGKILGVNISGTTMELSLLVRFFNEIPSPWVFVCFITWCSINRSSDQLINQSINISVNITGSL